jgi:transposase-like protein
MGAEMAKRQSLNELFRGRHVDQAIIIVCVRWYLRSKLSFRDLVEMMAERGLTPAHTTILRWVQRYVPDLRSAGIALPVTQARHGESTRHT